ncbi:MAG: hypothetical protein IPI84_10805 [Holophagaceae bacterium]|nr:hypothetical protein [Holophagaceae bacterium]
MSLLLDHWYYLLPLAAIGYLWWSRRSASVTDVQALLGRGAQVVDVRTRSEFKAGAHPKAINIPLDELEGRTRELDQARPVLVRPAAGAPPPGRAPRPPRGAPPPGRPRRRPPPGDRGRGLRVSLPASLKICRAFTWVAAVCRVFG